MSLIPKRNAVDVYVNVGNTISITNPDIYVPQTGSFEEVVVTIHPDDVDVVIAALKAAQQEARQIKIEELEEKQE